MKNLFLALVHFMWATLAFGQYSRFAIEAQEGEAIVIAQSGLKLRANPGFAAKTVVVIPFGEKVKVVYNEDPAKFFYEYELENQPPIYDADSIEGNWVDVRWKGHRGFAFSAYIGSGIFKMEEPFYLLFEQQAWCWNDAYISSSYNYYGVYPNKDTSEVSIKKMKPIFYNQRGEAGITFTMKQKESSLFAFAANEPYSDRTLPTYKFQRKSLSVQLNPMQPNLVDKLSIPESNWELKIKAVEENAAGNSYTIQRLIIRDKKTGAWHYLLDSKAGCEGAELKLVGDIDGDGITDFMLHYYSGESGADAIFLSRNSGKNRFVHLAGIYFWGDCC